MLKSVWRTTNISVHTKIKIFRSNVLSILQYGAECWKTTVTIQGKLGVPHQKPLMHYQDLWPNTISNEELRNRTRMETGKNYTNTAVVMTCPPHALQLHHQNSPRARERGDDKERHGGAPWRKTSISGE